MAPRSPPSLSDSELLRLLAECESFSVLRSRRPDVSMEHLRAVLDHAAQAIAERAPSRSKNGAARRIDSSRVRVYSDGAARGNPGPSGAGAVLVEPSGQVIDRLAEYLGIQTNNYAEYMGLLIGLRRARELGAKDVEVYADSELMIRQLSGRYQVKSATLRPLHTEAMELLKEFVRVKLVHVPREMNREADIMSNRAIDEYRLASTARTS